MPASEDEPIGPSLDNLFISVANFSGRPGYRDSLPSALAHDRDGVAIVISSRGRLFKIPRETKIKDIVAGARWPRQPNTPIFEDLRRAPRKRSDEIDGVDLMFGWMMEIYVVPKDKLGAL